jgi:hypothetical protein
MRTSHLALMALGTLALGACGAPSQNQQFAVSGAVAPAAATFRNTDPQINDRQAREICVEGYEKLDTQTLPAEPGSFEQWRVQCAPHDPWVWLTL